MPHAAPIAKEITVVTGPEDCKRPRHWMEVPDRHRPNEERTP